MTAAPPLAHPVDALRKYNPDLSMSDLSDDEQADIRARLDAVSNEFEDETGRAVRERRTGAPDEPRTWEYHDARRAPTNFPLRVDLDHDDVVPIDPSQDTIEVRTGRDSWDDITDGENDDWWLDYNDGQLKIFRFLVQRIYWEAPDERYLRATYRYGALGGDTSRGGQTTLSSQISDSATSFDVDDASRLPTTGILLLGDSEYVRLTDIDYSADTITVDRGVRRTSRSSHNSGATVHYCPERVRDGVAAKTGMEMINTDMWRDKLISTGDEVSLSEKKSDLQDEWETTLANQSGVVRM